MVYSPRSPLGAVIELMGNHSFSQKTSMLKFFLVMRQKPFKLLKIKTKLNLKLKQHFLI